MVLYEQNMGMYDRSMQWVLKIIEERTQKDSYPTLVDKHLDFKIGTSTNQRTD